MMEKLWPQIAMTTHHKHGRFSQFRGGDRRKLLLLSAVNNLNVHRFRLRLTFKVE